MLDQELIGLCVPHLSGTVHSSLDLELPFLFSLSLLEEASGSGGKNTNHSHMCNFNSYHSYI